MTRHRRQTLAALVLACPALAGAKLTPAEEGRVGGIYSNACSDGAALRLRLFGDTLSIERGGKAVAAKSFKASSSLPSGTPPPAFKTAYIGQTQGGERLVLVLTHDADGLFATLAGEALALAPLGAGVQGHKLRHCDPNRNALPGAAAAPTAPTPPSHPSELLREPKFKAAYLKALGPLGAPGRDKWLATLTGPAPALRTLRVAGTEMQLASVCKPHDCYDHNAVLLYDAAQPAVYGKVQQAGRTTLLGNPPAPIAAALEPLWQQEWRGGK
ncbi:MAG TPA: Ivy family c-type lysozyme inhibitor [Rubrivivax sp.]|nr:Ivy family c-type lysozyme inhibitor [Rubrivivax sp.]HPO18163.1 Ivy family c-type lysozyme inhibitor [Rubrivivax sp.]